MIDDLPVIFFVNAIHFHRLGIIDKIKQRGEGIAQADATTATVTEIEDALHFVQDGIFVIKFGVFPVERVTGRSLQAAFAFRGCHLSYSPLGCGGEHAFAPTKALCV